MKKATLLLTSLLLGTLLFGQSPQKMSYQAVIRNSSNDLILNSTVGMKVSILQGSSSGTAIYEETQTPVSNDNGLISIEIGDGTVLSGDFSTIDWSSGPYFIKTEVDPAGSTNYTITAASELLSVPYALYAEKSNSTNCSSCDAHFVNTDTDDAINGDLTVDNIVYSSPHVHYAYVSEADFSARGEDATVHKGTGNGGTYIANSNFYGLIASVEIPFNAVITNVEFYYYDTEVNIDLKFYFWRYLFTGGYNLIGDVTEVTSSGSGVISLGSGLPATYYQNSKYEIVVAAVDGGGSTMPWPGNTLLVRGVKVTYELDKAP